jgi:hypothetical protein
MLLALIGVCQYLFWAYFLAPPTEGLVGVCIHPQVQVPSFGTETVECGVCQHPFLISAN